MPDRLKNIKWLSEFAIASAIRRITEAGALISANMLGVFSFNAGGRVWIGDANVDEKILTLGISRSSSTLDLADTMAYSLVYGKKGALVECYPGKEKKRYILLLDIVTKDEWWIEGDMKEKIYYLTTYGDIPFNIREKIEHALVEKAWQMLKVNSEMFPE